jgi:CheY-like chemotaxis protein
MSHEIRTPMNAIMGYSQLMLRDTSLGNSARESLKVIKRSGEHLLNILNNILDMAKIESGRLEITPVTFNLGRHVQDLEAMFRLPAQAKELQLEVRLGGEPVEYITADEGKLRQVLINLLGNAIKFTQRGRVELRVSLDRRSPSDQDLTARSDEGLWLSAHVEDTGIGMTPAEIARLFEPFVQGKAGKHIQQGGTGLGLAISREVARSLGGDITVTSSPGSGSTFHFEVPVRSSTALHFMGQSVRRGRILGIRAEQAPRVLIADDMPDNREWLMRLLTALGFSVRAVENGEAAVQVHAEWKPRLVLMDVHMPGMDGLDATRRIRSTPSGNGTAIIALTADAMEQQRANAFASGVDTFISKPCAEDELLEKILKHLPEIAYTYEDEPSGKESGKTASAIPGAASAEQAIEVPADLIPRMREAIADGDKALLDRLILTTEERGNGASARALQRLADHYNYERLTELLEKACLR